MFQRTKDVDLGGEHVQGSFPKASLGHDLDCHRLLRPAINTFIHLQQQGYHVYRKGVKATKTKYEGVGHMRPFLPVLS